MEHSKLSFGHIPLNRTFREISGATYDSDDADLAKFFDGGKPVDERLMPLVYGVP